MKKENRALYQDVQKRLIASLLFDSTSISRVLELITEEDIEEPDLSIIFSHMAELSRKGEGISHLSVAELLQTSGMLAKTGGPPTLYSLSIEGEGFLRDASPVIYARIIKESSAKAKISRTLTESSGDFKDDSGVQAVDAVANLQVTLNEALLKLGDASTMTNVREGFDSYLDLLEERKCVSEENASNSDGLQGIPSLLPTLNYYTTGWGPGQMITVGAKTGIGKALDVETPMLTSNGWSTMGEIAVGDEVYGRDGKLTKVTNVTEHQENRTCYSVVFENGKTIVADADHQWLVEDDRNFNEKIMTTVELREKLKKSGRHHAIRSSKPIEFAEKSLPIHPYALGCWLNSESQVPMRFFVESNRAYTIVSSLLERDAFFTAFPRESGIEFQLLPSDFDDSKLPMLIPELEKLEIGEHKRIPEAYLKGGVHQRKELLNGLLATSVSGVDVKFDSSDGFLMNGFQMLTASLGFVTYRSTDANGDHVIRLKNIERTNSHILFTSINEVATRPVKCIEVDNENHVYLAGYDLIPTHNSIFAVNCAVAAAKANSSVMFFSLEMSKTQIEDRIVASTTGITLNKLKQGGLDENERSVLMDQFEEMGDMKILIDVEPKLTVDMIKARALRRAQSEDGLDLIILDYLQLVAPAGRFSSRQEAVADISRNIKLLAKQLDIPIIVLVQLNRERNRDDENALPSLEQIRESGAIGQDSDVVVLLHRDKALDDTTPHTLVILAKNRDGEAQKTIRCHSNLECSIFREVTRVKDIEVDLLSEEDLDELSDDLDLGEFDDDNLLDFADIEEDGL